MRKIIESLFCIVLLNDTMVKNGIQSPNPNVYYEYGLMTSLNKKIIPLQREDQKLAFNIQSLDTIKYTNTTFSVEMDAAIKSILIKPEKVEEQKTELIPQKLMIYLGLKGIIIPQLPRGSDIELAFFLGSDLGFFLLADYTNDAYCYLMVIKNNEDEDNLVLYLKTLLHRILPVRTNIERQIQQFKEIAFGKVSISGRRDFSPMPMQFIQEKQQLIYLERLIKLIDNTKIFIYRESFRNASKISDGYNEIEISMKLNNLILIDDKEIESLLSK